MKLVPVGVRDAQHFVREYHRHLPPPLGGVFALGVAHEGLLVGVVIVGRPIARALDDGQTLEVTRCATSPAAPMGAPSKLYSQARRAAHALGYLRLVTTTLQSESGASLRGAGWKQLEMIEPRPGWDCASRRRLRGALDGQAKVRWEVAC